MPPAQLTNVVAPLLERLDVVSSSVNPRSTSGIGILRDNANRQQLYFKRPKRPGAAAVEAAELQRIAILRDAVNGIDAMKFESFCTADNVLLSEYVADSQSLFNELCNRSQWWSRWRQTVTPVPKLGLCVGKWLNRYHDTSLEETSEYAQFVEFIVDRCTAKLQSLTRKNPTLISSETAASIREYLNHPKASSGLWGPLAISQIHGDFSLANILVTPSSRLVVIDFADTRRGFALEDLVRCWHAAWSLSQVSPACRPFANAVLEGYEFNRATICGELWKLLRCWNALTYLLTAMTVRSRFNRRMRRLVDALVDVNRKCINSLAANSNTISDLTLS